MSFKRFYKEIHKLSVCLFCTILLPLSAFADTGSPTNVNQVLKNLEDLLTSGWGKAICTLAIAGVGYACFVLGRLPINRALAVAIGAACVMGAGAVLQQITG